jgi:hypothetical protein
VSFPPAKGKRYDVRCLSRGLGVMADCRLAGNHARLAVDRLGGTIEVLRKRHARLRAEVGFAHGAGDHAHREATVGLVTVTGYSCPLAGAHPQRERCVATGSAIPPPAVLQI